jgi:hypothetical protein
MEEENRKLKVSAEDKLNEIAYLLEYYPLKSLTRPAQETDVSVFKLTLF